KLVGHRFGLVLSSPLSRALDTARLAGYPKGVQTTDDLLGGDYGADEGRTTADIRVGRPGWSIWDDGPDGGESIEDVGVRVDRVIARVRAQSGDALLFAHAHVL